MKKIVCLFLLIFAVNASANTLESEDKKVSFSMDAYYSFSFYQYTEPDLMSIDGIMNVANLNFTLITPFLYQSLYGYAAFGSDMKYTGSTVNLITNQKTAITAASNDNFYGVEYKIGPNLNLGSVDLNMFIGVGYRWLRNLISGSGAYKRIQDYIYIPIGANVTHSLPKDFFMNYEINYRVLIYGKNKSFMSSVNLSDMEFVQREGLGLKAKIGFGKKFKHSSFFINAFFDYWSILNSSTHSITVNVVDAQNKITSSKILTFVEPANTTHQFGLEIGIRF